MNNQPYTRCRLPMNIAEKSDLEPGFARMPGNWPETDDYITGFIVKRITFFPTENLVMSKTHQPAMGPAYIAARPRTDNQKPNSLEPGQKQKLTEPAIRLARIQRKGSRR